MIPAIHARAHSVFLIVFVCLGAASETAASAAFRVVSQYTLATDEIARPRDIRWATPTEVYIGLGRKGVVRTRADKPSDFTIVMPAADRGGFPVSSRVAIGAKHLVVGAALGAYGWFPLNAGAATKVQQRGLLTLVDLDARADTVAILGAESGEVQGLDRNGVIAWTGSLSKNLSDQRPLMNGRAKPGGKDMARCGFLETGAIRLMLDGSVVIVPGVEPGVFRYDEAGKLVQTWDTEPFGIVDDCDIDDTELRVLGSDFARRSEWLASRLTVDDVVPLRKAVALILRRVKNGVTEWDLLILPFKGKPEKTPLPVSLPTPRGHSRGDVRGDRLVLLLFDAPLPNQPPSVETRVVVLSTSP